MANYNARDFLRDSIAGDVSGGISQPRTNVSRNSNLDGSQIPPILVVPPNIDETNFVAMIEEAYGINIYKNYQNNLSESQKILHSLDLINIATDYFSNNNYKAASDLLSICAILYPNYFFNYLLALCRYSLQDFSGSLKLINLSISQLKNKQLLTQDLTQLSKETNFLENFYLFYIILLIRNFEISYAKEITQFSLDNKIFNSTESVLTLIKEFSVLQEPETFQQLVIFINQKTSEINDVQIKTKILSELKAANL